MDILDAFLQSARRECGYDPAGSVVIAFSGGPDSTALLDLHVRAGGDRQRIVAVHLDHALRPESAREAAVAAERARGYGVRVVVRRVDVRSAASGQGLEAAGRRERYRLLASAAARFAIRTIATGHHRDDRVETVLLRILRGAGPRGLAGIPLRRRLGDGHVVRPLAPFSRSALLEYLELQGLDFTHDPSNLDGSNLRSRVRTRLIPGLLASTDCVLALEAAARTLDRRVQREVARASAFPGLAGRPLLLGELLRARRPRGAPPPDRRLVERVAGVLLEGRGQAEIGEGWRVRPAAGAIEFVPPSPAPPISSSTTVRRYRTSTLPCPGSLELPCGGRIIAQFADPRPACGAPGREVIDAAAAPPPYEVRAAVAGDRFRPLGLRAETTVFRFLMGQGVPRELRGETPVVLSGGRPVWVVGYRIDDRAKITGETSAAVALELG